MNQFFHKHQDGIAALVMAIALLILHELAGGPW